MISAELTKARLTSSKILSQVYDGTSIMAGHCGGGGLLQQRENRKTPCVHCLNHQLHLVVVHAMSVEQAINDFLHVCGSLYDIFRKPTVALHYNGKKLNHLLDQRWTGHPVSIAAFLNSFQNITSLLQEMGI